jgi:hypothetical protein
MFSADGTVIGIPPAVSVTGLSVGVGRYGCITRPPQPVAVRSASHLVHTALRR